MTTPAIPLPGTQTARVELGSGVSCDWIEGGRVLNLKIENVTRTAIDVWGEKLDAYFNAIPDDYHSLILYEIGGIPLTPYLRARTNQLAQKHTTQSGKGAVVLRPSSFSIIIQRFVEWDVQRQTNRAQQRVFMSRSVALEWLLVSGE